MAAVEGQRHSSSASHDSSSSVASTSSLFLPPLADSSASPSPELAPLTLKPEAIEFRVDSPGWDTPPEEVEEEVITMDDTETEEEEELSGEETEEEEEDPDSHPLYLLLSTSALPGLRQYWDACSLVLVPPRRTLPSLTPLLVASRSPTPSVSPMPSPAIRAGATAGGGSGGGGGGFEFVRGGKGVEGEVAGRSGAKEKEKKRELREALETYVGLHAFKIDKDGETWISNVKESKVGYPKVRLELSRGLVHLEWVNPITALPFPSVEPVLPDNSSTKTGTSSTKTSPELAQPAKLNRLSSASSTTSDHKSRLSSLSSLQPSSTSFDVPTIQLPFPVTETSTIALPKPLPSIPSVPPPTPPPPLPTPPRSLQVVTETTIYRRPRPPLSTTPSSSSETSLKPPAPPPAPPPSKTSFRAPKWLRRGTSASAPPALGEKGPMRLQQREKPALLERVRVIAVDGQVVMNPEVLGLGLGSNSLSLGRTGSARKSQGELLTPSIGGSSGALGVDSSPVTRPLSLISTRSTWPSIHGGTGVPNRREFVADLTFLASPPSHLLEIAPALHSALVVIKFLVNEFKSNFALIQGFDSYAVQRIRKGILEKAWLQLARELSSSDMGTALVNEERANLPQLLENVVMGLLYTKIYATSLLPLFISENTAINHILCLYRERDITPSDLGVDVCDLGAGDLLGEAVKIMSRLRPTPLSEVATKQVSPELVKALSSDHGPSSEMEEVRKLLMEARTPLEVVSVMRFAMEEINSVLEVNFEGLRVAPDDMIPLLAWVIVKSGVEDIESVLYYVKTYRSDSLQLAEFDWSLVTFRAAVAFLLSDPLKALPSSPLPSVSDHQRSPINRRASDLPSFRNRGQSMYNLPSFELDPNSPPSSPRSLRAVNTTGRSSPGPARTFPGRISPSLSSPGRERPGLAVDTDVDTSPLDADSLTPRGRPDAPGRLPSAEEMPPPIWTQPLPNRERRQSLGVLPSASSRRLSFDDDPNSSGRESYFDTIRPKPLLSSSQSSSSDLQIRPRIMLPPSRSHWQPTLEPTPRTVIGRSQSHTLSGRQIGPVEMRRSGSENGPNAPAPPLSSSLASFGSNLRRTTTNDWSPSFWRGDSPASSERGISPSGSAGDGRRPSLSDDASPNNSWWWNGARSGAGFPHSATTSVAGDSSYMNDDSSIAEERLGERRARRHSASSADVLSGFFGGLNSSQTSSSARLAAVLSRPRPSSIVSVSSITSSAEFDHHSLTSSPPPLHHSSSSRHSVRRNTKSLMQRDSSLSSLTREALAPKVDSSMVLASSPGLMRIPSLPVKRGVGDGEEGDGLHRFNTDF